MLICVVFWCDIKYDFAPNLTVDELQRPCVWSLLAKPSQGGGGSLPYVHIVMEKKTIVVAGGCVDQGYQFTVDELQCHGEATGMLLVPMARSEP